MHVVSVLMFLIFCSSFVLIWYILRASVSCFLPNDYKELRRLFPNPLKKLRFLGGNIGSIKCKNTLKLDVYYDKLIVSTMGKALCLDYFSYSFTRSDFAFSHSLIVGPVQPNNLNNNWLSWMQTKEDINITIYLSKKNLDFILTLVQQAQQSH